MLIKKCKFFFLIALCKQKNSKQQTKFCVMELEEKQEGMFWVVLANSLLTFFWF